MLVARAASSARSGQPAVGLARLSDMGGDRGAVDAINLGELADPAADPKVGQQSLDLDRGETSLDAAQLTNVRTPRILKSRASPHLAGLFRPLEEPLYQGFRGRTGV